LDKEVERLRVLIRHILGYGSFVADILSKVVEKKINSDDGKVEYFLRSYKNKKTI
jgi:hypothetical protein